MIIEVNGASVFRVTTGERCSSGRPVLYLHGIPTWSWMWRNVLPETGHSTLSIAADLPGFGLSRVGAEYSFDPRSMAETMHSLLDRYISSSSRVCLVAHDFGALIGAEMISQAPGRFSHLVVCNTSMRHESWIGGGPLRILSIPWLGEFSMWLARKWMLQLAMYPFVADPEARSSPVVAGYWYPFERGFGSSLARFYQSKPISVEDFDRWRGALSGFSGESLILWGGRDPAFTRREMIDIKGLLPGAESLVFDNASHFLPEERPRAVGRRIRAFLEAH